jgi:flagellar basal-body rod protein FlgB
MGVRFIDSLFDRTFQGVEKNLDLTARRNEAIVSNIANAETPGYKAVDVNFANELDRAFSGNQNAGSPVKKTNAKHLDTAADSTAHLMADYSGAMRDDGNNVDIDIQMGQLAFNSSRFSMSTTLIKKKFAFLKMGIRMGSQ